MIKAIVGEKINLGLRLFDSSPDKKVRADLYSVHGEKVGSVYLYHVENGIYMNSDLSMPDHKSILVSYTVENSQDYSDIVDRIEGIPAKVEAAKFILGQVKQREFSTEFVKGVVSEITSNK